MPCRQNLLTLKLQYLVDCAIIDIFLPDNIMPLTVMPTVALSFVSESDCQNFCQLLEHPKNTNTTISCDGCQVEMCFESHSSRIAYLEKLSALSRTCVLEIDFCKISIGTRNWVYVDSENDLSDLLHEAYEHFARVPVVSV